jgi:hypothetical protein
MNFLKIPGIFPITQVGTGNVGVEGPRAVSETGVKVGEKQN